MLNPFGKKAKLLQEVRRLCVFNDKGQYWSRIPQEQAEQKKDQAINRIRKLSRAVGESSLPKSFIEGITSGEIRNDSEGKYYQALKNQFNSGCNQ